MYCPNCGNKIPPKAKYCPICGSRIKEFLDDSFQNASEIKKEDEIKEKNLLEDLFLNNNKETEIFQEETANYNIKVDTKYMEENKSIWENIEDIGKNTTSIINNIKNNKYLKGINNILGTIGIKIKNLQKFIFDLFNSKYRIYFQEDSKITNIIIILMSFILYIPIYNLIKNSEIIPDNLNKIFVIFITMIGTIVHQTIIMAGPFLALKLGSLNYMENIDKLLSKSIIITSSFIIAIVKLLMFLLFGKMPIMELILFGRFSFIIILLTIIIILIETVFIQSLILDKFKKENYIKLFYTIFLSLLVIEIFSYLIARPLMFILLGLL